MAASIFMKNTEIEGQGTGDYKDEVILNSVSFGESNDINLHSGNVENSNAYVFNIDCTKGVDGATPTIARTCTSGKHLDKVKLTVTKSMSGSNDARYPFVILTLSNVVITNHLVSLSDSDSSESFSLHYTKIEMTVTPQDDQGNKLPDGTWTYQVKDAKGT